MKEIETYAVYQRQIALSRDALEAILGPIEHREEEFMSGRCEICERKPMYGNNVNFSQKRTRRRFVLNVQRRRIEINGVRRTVNICTRCLRTMDKLPKAK